VSKLFVETERQLSSFRRFASAMADMPLLSVLFGMGLLTGMAWNAGFVETLIEMLPGWSQMLLVMPLFGSMIAVYALGGFATVSLVISITADLVLAPIRELQRRDEACID
jgi:hypothetical protein